MMHPRAAAASQGRRCRVLVAQPRRLAAVSSAVRVAAERGEQLCPAGSRGGGGSVGYAVHLQRVPPRPHASIEFCTAGVLLRRLAAEPLLDGASHVIVDEATALSPHTHTPDRPPDYTSHRSLTPRPSLCRWASSRCRRGNGT